MKLNEYVTLDATGLAAAVREGRLDGVGAVELARAACDAVNPAINAVIEFYDDAEAVAVRNRSDGPFAGVPTLRKDLGAPEAGRRQENGSRLTAGVTPARDGGYIERARAGGLNFVGRSATPEFGMSGFTESVLHGITRNPWDLTRTAGGSSGGAAAAVAAGIVPLAHASDGGGSIRIPAACCSVLGLIPSRGRISGYPIRQDPLFGLSREFVVCKTVRDMAGALDVLAGPAPGDPFVITRPDRPYVAELQAPTETLHIGLVTDAWGDDPVVDDVRGTVERIGQLLEALGHDVELFNTSPVSMVEVGEVVGQAFVLSLARLGALADGLGRPLNDTTLEPVNLALYERARSCAAADFMAWFDRAGMLRIQCGEAFAGYDLIVTPTLPRPADIHGRFATSNPNLSADEYLHGDAAYFQFLGLFNITGQPSVSVPVGASEDGLPIGVQLAAGFGREDVLVRVARDLEETLPWAERLPPVNALHPG